MTTGADYRNARNNYDAERQKRREHGGRKKGNHAIKVETNVTHLLQDSNAETFAVLDICLRRPG